MMHQLQISLLFILSLVTYQGFAQILVVEPQNPSLDETIRIVYDGTQGNAALKDYTGEVYMHTGVITTESTSPSDWKYVVSDWCENTEQTKMAPLGNNRYEKYFTIRNFYGIADNERILKLVFLFRSADCSKVGRTAEQGDIFYTLGQGLGEIPDYLNFSQKNDTLLVETSAGVISVTAYSPTILNFFSAPNFTTENQQSYAVTGQKQQQNVTISETTDFLLFKTDSIALQIAKSNLELALVYEADTVLKSKKWFEFQEGGILSFGLHQNETIYGTGARASQMNHHGKVLRVNNSASYGYGYGENNLNITLPVMFSDQKYALMVDNHAIGQWDFGVENPTETRYLYRNGQADIFVWVGKSNQRLSEQYVQLTGYQLVPPVWALGYIQSKYGYETQAEAEKTVADLLDHDFPLDALVLDLYWFGDKQAMGDLDWDYSAFANPIKMMDDFKQQNVQTILITEPYFTKQSTNFQTASDAGYFAKNSTGQTYIINGFWAGDAALLNMFDPAAQDWMWTFYKNRIDEGASGWWTDLGEPENHPSDMVHYNAKPAAEIHNIYNLEWAKMLHQKYSTAFPDRRFFNLTRSGFAGMQRYCTFPWSGDIQRSFEGLRAQVPIMLSAGLTGIGYMHSDIGGFTGGNQNDELYTRWVQFGTFAPIFRIHGSGIPTTPLAFSAQTQQIVKRYLHLRLKLLPYNYTLAFQNSKYGWPLARPMDFYSSENTSFKNNNEQYYWGQNLIVAPVFTEAQTTKTVALPLGNWYLLKNLKKYVGNSTHAIPLTIDDIPVFVKGGAIIPTIENIVNTASYDGKTLFVNFYPDEETINSSFVWFDDDKKSPNSVATENYDLVKFEAVFSENQINLYASAEKQATVYSAGERKFIYVIQRAASNYNDISYNNTAIQPAENFQTMLNTSNSSYFDEFSSRLFIHTVFGASPSHLAINNPTLQIANAHQQNVQVFPNPATDFLNISFINLSHENTHAEIVDAQGKTLWKKELQPNTTTLKINVQHLQQGVYFFLLKNKDTETRIKWIKK